MSIPELSEVITAYQNGNYKGILRNATSQRLFRWLDCSLPSPEDQNGLIHEKSLGKDYKAVLVLMTALTAFNAFLQANVTGPPLDMRDVFGVTEEIQKRCFSYLTVDGVSVYEYIPLVEMFVLAKMIFTTYFPRMVDGKTWDCKWMRIRISAYHLRLLSGMSGGRMSDSDTLQRLIEKDIKDLEQEIIRSVLRRKCSFCWKRRRFISCRDSI